jgi:hypothetical protein
MSKPLNLFSGASGGMSHIEARRDLLRMWAKDRWAFLTGTDLDGTPLIVTQDESAGDNEATHRPFPTDKAYLKVLVEELFGPQQTTLIDKSRQMMVSTLCCLLLYHTILFQKGRKCFVSKQTQDLAEILVADKIRGVHGRTPAWFQAAMPLTDKPAAIITAEQTGSQIICVAQNAAVRAFKGNTATIVLVDEAAVQEFFGDMLQAAGPMARRIWAVTTAYHGNPGAEVFFKLKTEV